MILRHHLPPESEWPAVLASVMGSPDPYGRQLNGMGSGVSSTSKICVISRSTRPEADVDFTFVQIGVRDGSLDMAGNCGNMSAALGPISLDEGLLAQPLTVEADPSGNFQTALVSIFNTNTNKVIQSRFKVTGDPPRYDPAGDYAMDGVPGTQSKIVMSFINPAGAKTGRALPTSNPVDMLTLPDGSSIQASLVDVSNPGVFIRVSDLRLANPVLDPAGIESDPILKERLEHIRRAGAAMMDLDPSTQSVPKIVLVFSPSKGELSSGMNIRCLALSMGQAHKAVPLTLALCLGSAVRIPGTIPNELAEHCDEAQDIVIGHPSGRLEVGIKMSDGTIRSVDLYRTARVLMKGGVFYYGERP